MKNRKSLSTIIQFLTIIIAGVGILSCSTNSTSSYSLTTSVSPAEAGTIAPSEGDFDESEQVQVTATANDHWVFTGWGGDYSGTENPVTIVMDDDKSLSALFEKREYSLKINIEGEGEVTERLLNAKATDYPAEAIVELKAVPEDGWTFLEWSGDLSGPSNSRSVTINETKEVTATFVEEKAKLNSMVLTFLEKDYSTEISEFQVSTIDEVPFGISGEVLVKSLNLSPNATSNISEGDSFDVDNPPTIVVTSQSGRKENTYEIVIKKDKDAVNLFNNYDQKKCENFDIIEFDDLILENNMWNSDHLDSGSYNQCIYFQNRNQERLYGWQWSYPENEFGVNAFPEVFYGQKSWYEESTNQNLPRKLSEIGTLKASYETKTYRNNGSFNLAFDIWLTSSSEVSPDNISFEIMIWEDENNLSPGEDSVGRVSTSNGDYNLYISELEDSNALYVAFKRTNYRNKVTVDIDELIEYLLENNIIPGNHYMASIDFGNEVGNGSQGYTIIKQFDIQME